MTGQRRLAALLRAGTILLIGVWSLAALAYTIDPAVMIHAGEAALGR